MNRNLVYLANPQTCPKKHVHFDQPDKSNHSDVCQPFGDHERAAYVGLPGTDLATSGIQPMCPAKSNTGRTPWNRPRLVVAGPYGQVSILHKFSPYLFGQNKKALYAPITWGSQHSSPAERGGRGGDSVFCSATEQIRRISFV